MTTDVVSEIRRGDIYTRRELGSLGFQYRCGFGFGADTGEVFEGEAGELILKPLVQSSNIHFDEQRFKVIGYKGE